MTASYGDGVESEAWEQRIRRELIPKLVDSGAVVSLVPTGQTDVKFAVELGLSIMLNKPIIAVVQPGVEVPPKLALVADRVLVLDLADPDSRDRLAETIQAMLRTEP